MASLRPGASVIGGASGRRWRQLSGARPCLRIASGRMHAGPARLGPAVIRPSFLSFWVRLRRHWRISFGHSQVALDCCAVIVASARFRCCGRAINCGEHPGRGYLRNAGVRARGRRVHATNEKVARSQVVDEGPRAVRWSQVEEAFYVGNYRGNFVGYIDRGPDGAFRSFDRMSTLRGEASTLEESMACLDALFFATSGDRGRQ